MWGRAGCSVTPCLLGTWAMVASGTQWPSGCGTVSCGRASCPGHATLWGTPKGSTCHPLSPREGSRCPQGPAGWGTCQRAVMCHHGAGVAARGWQGMSPCPVCVPMGDPFEWGCDALGPPWSGLMGGENVPRAVGPPAPRKSPRERMGMLWFSPSLVSPLGWPCAPAWAVAY